MKRAWQSGLLLVIGVAAALAGYFLNPGTRTPTADVAALLAAALPDPEGSYTVWGLARPPHGHQFLGDVVCAVP
jgi:hypothetical protein